MCTDYAPQFEAGVVVVREVENDFPAAKKIQIFKVQVIVGG